jgi:SpoVK/Ycf46/Vps4 family AAA+-type ATPase
MNKTAATNKAQWFSHFVSKEPKIDLAQVRMTGQTRMSIEAILAEQEKGHLLRAEGLKPRYRLLFWGPAGTGKTLAAEGIAQHLGKTFHTFNLESLSGTNPDEALKSVMDALRAINSCDDLFLFDEFDAIASHRSNTNAGGAARQTSNALLIAFEQIQSKAIITCATNFISTIDPAFRRRFDTICKFELPDIVEREAIILMTLARHKKQAPKDDVKEAAKRTEGLSYHEAEELTLAAIKGAIMGKTQQVNLITHVPAALERRMAFQQFTG